MLLKNICSLKPLHGFWMSTLNKESSTQLRKVVLFPGNGIGPEISKSVTDIFEAYKVPI